MKTATKSATSVGKKPLSPRGRGAVPAPADEDRLLRLFADNMKRLRQDKQLSQEALADLCDLDRTYISGIERKRRNLGIRNIQRIADALGVDVRALFDPDGLAVTA
ncbi:helix-turn-helix domain-containing protein [Roseateles sp. BYS96W]|uniref:Helix-turn-helix domain-containing protein n=1 Tax=Pelomonas nitida TaxID=3299027 RepID=A0ABW7G1R5_9BURK